MTEHQHDPQPRRNSDEGEVRNWMLPLADQEFRVPSPERFSLPPDRVEWSGRVFTLNRWFRRLAMVVVAVTLVVTALRWVMSLLG